MQGALAQEGTDEAYGGTPAQDALEFARSAEGVGTALVGCSSAEHAEENLALLERGTMR